MEGKVTQDQFDKMVKRHQKMETINDAIESNDYDAYVTATKPSKDDFNQMVSQYTSKKASQTAIENNDYKAFITAIK